MAESPPSTAEPQLPAAELYGSEAEPQVPATPSPLTPTAQPEAPAVRPQAPVAPPPSAVASPVEQMPATGAGEGDADESDGEHGVASGRADPPSASEESDPLDEAEEAGRGRAPTRKARDVVPGGPRSETSSSPQPVAHGGRAVEEVNVNHSPDEEPSPGSVPRKAADEKADGTKSRPLGEPALEDDEPDGDSGPGEGEIEQGAAEPDSLRTRPARVERKTLPTYPRRARRLGAEGTTELEVFVDEGGIPTRARVIQSSGRLDMDAAAEEAVLQWRFSPAQQGEKSVSSSVTVTIEFRLRN